MEESWINNIIPITSAEVDEALDKILELSEKNPTLSLEELIDMYCNFPEFEDMVVDISFKEIILNNNIWIYSRIQDKCIKGCYIFDLKNMAIPEGTKTIGEFAFNTRWFLEKVIIPDSVTHIEKYAFLDCDNLKSVILPANIKIDWSAFSGCEKLTTVIYKGTIDQFNNTINIDWVFPHNFKQKAKIICSDGDLKI